MELSWILVDRDKHKISIVTTVQIKLRGDGREELSNLDG